MKKKKLFIVLLISILVILGSFSIYYFFIREEPQKTKEVEKEKKKEPVTAGIYTLIDNPTKYQKEVFNELKDLLNEETYDEQTLAELIVKNFMVEFYTLSNVTSKEVRGTQYVANELKERFKAFGDDIYTFYPYHKNLKDLEVKNIEIISSSPIKYNYKDEKGEIPTKNNLSGYKVTISWEYKDDTKYTTEVTIVKWDENYSIVKVQHK